jgi:hypothetical protein
MLFRFLKGGFGFALLFIASYFALQHVPADSIRVGDLGRIDVRMLMLDKSLHQSRHLFVEVLEDDTPVYERPNTAAAKLKRLNAGYLLLLADVETRGGYEWNKVLIAPRRYGWMQRLTPPRIGVPSRRVSWAGKFYFYYRDLYALLAGLLGFIWGWLNFRIKPT